MATGTELATEVRRTLHDAAGTRWADAELIDYINAGQRAVVALIPEANTIEEVVSISNGIARQTLPAGGIKFVKAARNYSFSDEPEGVITYVEKNVLDQFDPDWEYDTTLKTDGLGVNDWFEHWCHDPREGSVYYLYPPPPAEGTKKIALVYVDTPDEIVALANTLSLEDEYYDALVQYVIYRALTKESRDSMPSAYRQELWGNFLTALGLKVEAEDKLDPKAHKAPEGP